MNVVNVIHYPPEKFPQSEISRREILRYMGCKNLSPETEELINNAISECIERLTYKIVYREFPLQHKGNYIDLGFVRTESKDLKKALSSCDSIMLFAATVGIDIDRVILKHGKFSPSLALAIQALGAERIEALCNTFCHEINVICALNGKTTLPRFSPGYGDLPLSLQRDIFTALDCTKHIGLTLNNSLLMSPTKSVSAIIGIKNNEETHENT